MHRQTLVSGLLAGIFLSICAPSSSWSQSLFQGNENPEDFRIEVMGSGWLLNAGGQVQANGTPADFVNDLKVFQGEPTFFGRFVFKPGRRHRIEVEGTPFSIDGRNSINRPIVYRGQTFNINQIVTSNATLDYFYGGYQFDVLTGPKGHLGFSAGAAYLNATGTLSAQLNSALANTSTTATKTQRAVLPLAGVDFRIFLIPGHKLLEIEGGVRGMYFGDYGYYGQAIGQGGISLGAFTVLAGYRAVNTSLYGHSNSNPSGITARLKGPIFSGMFRW